MIEPGKNLNTGECVDDEIADGDLAEDEFPSGPTDKIVMSTGENVQQLLAEGILPDDEELGEMPEDPMWFVDPLAETPLPEELSGSFDGDDGLPRTDQQDLLPAPLPLRRISCAVAALSASSDAPTMLFGTTGGRPHPFDPDKTDLVFQK